MAVGICRDVRYRMEKKIETTKLRGGNVFC